MNGQPFILGVTVTSAAMFWRHAMWQRCNVVSLRTLGNLKLQRSLYTRSANITEHTNCRIISILA